VYSLGAALYHVLTSRPPFQAANVAETIRQVFDEEPMPPRRLNPAIHRDLETICLKCLQKEPSRRYESALALAEDLRRYLNQEPILARPTGYAERTWRWCRRNPKLAAAIGTAITLALTTVALIVVSNIRISAALAQADRNLQNAQQVVDELLTRVSEDELLKKSGFDPLRRELLAKAQSHYQSFLNENADNPRIRRELANAHFRVAVIERELDHKQAAVKSLKSAEHLQRKILTEEPQDPRVRRSLSETLTVTGDWHTRDRNWQLAIEALQEAVQLRDALANEFPDDRDLQRLHANVHMNLGIALKEKGNLAEAVREEELSRSLRSKLQDRFPADDSLLRDSGVGAYNLALLYLARFDQTEDPAAKDVEYVQAAQSLDDGIRAFEELVRRDPSHPQYLYRLLISYRMRGSLSNDPELFYTKAEPVAAKLDRENPETPKFRFEHAALLLDYSDFLANSERLTEAFQRLDQLNHLLAPLASEHAEASEHLAQAHRLWAEFLTDESDADERRTHVQEAIKYFRLLERQTGEAKWLVEIASLEKLLDGSASPQ
jgi:hypothetical protein